MCIVHLCSDHCRECVSWDWLQPCSGTEAFHWIYKTQTDLRTASASSWEPATYKLCRTLRWWRVMTPGLLMESCNSSQSTYQPHCWHDYHLAMKCYLCLCYDLYIFRGLNFNWSSVSLSFTTGFYLEYVSNDSKLYLSCYYGDCADCFTVHHISDVSLAFQIFTHFTRCCSLLVFADCSIQTESPAITVLHCISTVQHQAEM